MTHIFILNEVSLLRFLALTLVRKQVDILAVTAIFPPFQRILDAVARRALASGRARYLVERFPELKPYWEYDRRFHFHEAFKKYEPWQNKYYDFERSDALGPIYGYGYKLITTNYVFPRTLEIHLLETACRKLEKDDFRVYGILRDTLDMCRAYFGEGAARGVKAMWFPYRLINTLITVPVGLYSLLWIASRVRPFAKSEPVFAIADNINASSDFATYEVLKEGGKVVLELRNAAAFGAPDTEPGEYIICKPRDGFYGLGGAVAAMAMTIGGVFALWRQCANTVPTLFYSVTTMPFKQAVIRGLLNRYRPKFYWGRDDYNVEHILRRGELHRVGGKSLGISHAVITNFCSLFPQWRYISFDTYFTFGVPLCRPYFSVWPQDMKLRSAGMFRLSRQQIRAQWPKGEAILIAIRVAWYEPEMKKIVRAVARAFPERRVLLQIKAGTLDKDTAKSMNEEWRWGLSNIHHVTSNIYQLLEQAQYLISDVSSLITEAIQLGIPTLFADVIEMEYSIFRVFPGLGMKNADEAVSALKSLDSGETPYPYEEYMKIMGLDHGLTVYDLLREEVGLLPLEPPSKRTAS